MNAWRNIPILAGKELHSYFISPIAYVFLVIFLALAGLFTFELGGFIPRGVASLNDSFFTWHPFLYMVFVPAVGMRFWAEEKRSGTAELLFTLPTSVTQAVIAKFVAGSIFLALALVLTFPIVITVNVLGDPDNGAIFCGYLGSLLVAMGFLGVASLTSAFTRNQIVSFIIAVVVCLLLILAGFPPVTGFLEKFDVPPSVIEVVSSIGIYPHFDAMRRGVVDLRDVLYYGSLMVFGLCGTTVLLNQD